MVRVPKYVADVRSKFICFPGGSLEQASSITVMQDSGGYLGTMAKFGPLVSSDSCGGVRGCWRG